MNMTVGRKTSNTARSHALLLRSWEKRRVYNFGNAAKIFLNTMFFHRTISSFRPSLILKPVVEWYTRFFNIKKYYSPSAK